MLRGKCKKTLRGVCFGYRSWKNAEYYIVGLGGYGYAYTLSHFQPDIGWRYPLDAAGSAKDHLKPATPYRLLVRVQGQKITLNDDDMPVFEHVLQSPLPIGQLGLFAWGDNRVEFTDMFVEEMRGTAFVVMKFATPYMELYNEVIKRRAEEDPFRLTAFHAGEVFGRVILQDIVRGIQEAKVVIAEITPANRNVYYEVGYAHALNVPTILMCERCAPHGSSVRGP
jgi:hypothetical protein